MWETLRPFLMEIIIAIFMAVFSALGALASKYVKRYINTKEKKDLANAAVIAVEQMYKTLHGKDKLVKAIEMLSNTLTEKKIPVTHNEMIVLIESALGRFNDAFHKNDANIEE